MKKILIPTDLSLNSYQTIDYVTELFANEQCEFYFLNAYNYGLSGLNAIEMLQADEEWFDKPKKESIEQLWKLVERYTLKSKNTKHAFNAISNCMNLTDSIKKNVEELSTDLIILTGRAKENVGNTTESILEKVRNCPILIVPPHASSSDGINLTIASDFKQKININEIDRFCRTLTNTNFRVGVLVLEKQNSLSKEACNNLEGLINYLAKFSIEPIGLEYIKSSYRLKDYAASNIKGILCIIDKKPDLFRKIGLYKSNVISILKKINTNTVLTIHQ
ncbi:hypothetical protein H0I23_04405 [Cellulophaga sp. HaHaR_3_176]|uniref:universal stress protein n=1 Tax=Cellulophaga sp. HaHaR_3_176 TaxID=1942464 RepID=UPI001C1F52F7|nr:universal stress protein [Cellulophaga sp. HaHaR_3_176]QWX84891.1 hypothetical protein H0I23_04405 [Cellulophaga sp. HaHaR_3_176]